MVRGRPTPNEAGAAAAGVAALLAQALHEHQCGHLQTAAGIYRDVLRYDPQCVIAHLNLGTLYQACGHMAEARHHYQAVLRLHPGSPEAYNNLGTILKAQGNIEAARRYYQIAVRLKPDFVEAQTNLGSALRALGDLEAAQTAYETALRYRPDDADAHTNLGCVLQEQGQLAAAMAHYQAALALRPDLALAHTNLGLALYQQGHHEAAIAQQQAALALQPDLALAHTNLGYLLQEQGRLEAALAHHQTALALDPTLAIARWNQATIWLAQGDLERGWAAYEWRWQAVNTPRVFPMPRWDGSSLAGRTILVIAEQGVGDELLFASCIPDLIARAGHCVLECDPRLAPLFARSFPTATVYGAHRDDRSWLAQAPAIDVYSPSGSLPRYLRPTLCSFPTRPGYLRPDATRVEQYRQRLRALGPGLKVGIAWRSRVARHQAPAYTALAQWGPVLTVPGVHFVNLQYDQAEAELTAAEAAWGVPIRRWDGLDLFNDFDGTAALLAALDLVIGPETAMTALAGSLGCPVWRLTSAAGSWTSLGTAFCPWFPSMRVVQQPPHTPWPTVLAQVAQELVLLAQTEREHRRQ